MNHFVIGAAILLAGVCQHAAAKEIPLELPKPEGKPGDAAKPVKDGFS